MNHSKLTFIYFHSRNFLLGAYVLVAITSLRKKRIDSKEEGGEAQAERKRDSIDQICRQSSCDKIISDFQI